MNFPRLGVSASTSQSALVGGVLPFALENGTTGVIAPEERRTFDHIIYVNIGDFPTHGLTGQLLSLGTDVLWQWSLIKTDVQAKHILSRSRLSESALQSIWDLTDIIVAEGFPDGCWTQLEIYVALHFLQARERLSLNQMAVQFAGSTPPEISKKIRRRSSYAQAGVLLSPLSPPVVPRSASLSSSPKPLDGSSLRHTASEATTTTRVRRLRVGQAFDPQDNSSVSQAGLEAVETVEEITYQDLQNPVYVPRPNRSQGTQRTHINDLHDMGTLVRESSIKTDTAGQARRLKTLIRARCREVAIEPEIESPARRQSQASIPDRNEAHEILIRKRRENLKSKDPSIGLGKILHLKQAKKKALDTQTLTFNEHELSLALREVVEFSEHVGVAEKLIDLGADVNFFKQVSKTKFKALRSDSFDSTPFNYIRVAASRRNVDMISLLASRGASPRSLEEALEQAIVQNVPNVVLALLQHGANPNANKGAVFRSAIASQNPALVRLLLRSRTKIHKPFLTSNLAMAVTQGQAEIVSLLVVYGADVSFDHFSALRRAVQAQRIDLILYVMKGHMHSEAASSVIDDAFSASSSLSVPEQYLIIEILLCAGARGDSVAKMLVSVVRAGHRSIAELLVMHGADLQYNNAEALKAAVSAANIKILRTLLLGKIRKECAGSLLDGIPLTCNDDQTYGLILPLISKGAAGIPLDKALVQSVQRKSTKTIELLLAHRASVDYNEAQALQMAVGGGDLALVNQLLNKGRPQPMSMQHILPLVPQTPAQLRYNMTKSIIDTAGPKGLPTSILSTELIKAVDPRSNNVDNHLADLLIAAGASVDTQQGKCFRLAAEKGSVELLELLIRNMKKPTSLCTAVSVSMKIIEPEVRRRFVMLLLDNGAKGSVVDQALIDGLEEVSIDEDLILSLLRKADVKYHQGQALLTAIQHSSAKIVASIIDTARTDLQCRFAALSVLLRPGTNDKRLKLKLLLQAGVSQEGLDSALVQEVRGERHADIIEMLLDHKASCEPDGGEVLELAINSHDDKLLEQLTVRKPSCYILGEMLPITMRHRDVTSRQALIAILLRGGARGSRVHQALIQEVCGSRPDMQLVRLLIQHGASVNYSEGKAIKAVVSKPLDIKLLKTLLAGNAAFTILPELIPLAMAHRQELRLPLLQVLLENGACHPEVDAALIAAVSEGGAAQPTIELLLKHDASVNFQNAEAIKIASFTGPPFILDCLLSRNPDPGYLPEALRVAMQAPIWQFDSKTPLRFYLVQLLTQNTTMDPEVLNFALIQAVQEMDHDLVKHLLKSGGDPNSMTGASVVNAARQGDIESLMLFTNSKLTADVCSDAFSATISKGLIEWHQSHELVLRIHDILLCGGATGPAVDQVLLSALISSHPLAMKYLLMILKCETRLDVSFKGGESLCTAVKKGLLEITDHLLRFGPDERILHQAFMCIFESTASERNLIKMAQCFFDYAKEGKRIYFEQNGPLEDPLYQTLHRHGEKPDLLQMLLDNGCGTESLFSWIFPSQSSPEEVSPLLWLLCQGDDNIESRTVKILLDRGADPNFRTSVSGNSPLIIASSLLQPLIVFELLKSGAQAGVEDTFGGTPLYYASQAGNLKSMEHLLENKADVEDESLHVAARRLDFSAVKLLLEYDASIDWPGTRFCDGRTPLGEVCCKADPKDNPAQLKKTLKLLIKANPNLQKVKNGKSLILLALDNDSPLLMARALLTACPSLQQELNDDYNIYSQDDFFYSLTMYTRHFKCTMPLGHRSLNPLHRCCNIHTCPAPDLEKLLRAYDCYDRFWNASAGADQPSGACGLPPYILAAQRQAEAKRREQAEQARVHAEAKAQRDAVQANLDADAEAERRRKRKELDLLEEQRAAEARAKEELWQAEMRNNQRRLAAEESEENARRARSRSEFVEQQERARQAAEEHERREKRKAEIKTKQLEEKARIEKDVIKARRDLIDSAAGFVRQAEHSGIGAVTAGRVLGEIE